MTSAFLSTYSRPLTKSRERKGLSSGCPGVGAEIHLRGTHLSHRIKMTTVRQSRPCLDNLQHYNALLRFGQQAKTPLLRLPFDSALVLASSPETPLSSRRRGVIGERRHDKSPTALRSNVARRVCQASQTTQTKHQPDEAPHSSTDRVAGRENIRDSKLVRTCCPTQRPLHTPTSADFDSENSSSCRSQC